MNCFSCLNLSSNLSGERGGKRFFWHLRGADRSLRCSRGHRSRSGLCPDVCHRLSSRTRSMPGRHNKKQICNFQLAPVRTTQKCTDGGRMWTHVSFVPHVFVSRLLQCILHASQKHHPLWSYVPTVLPKGKCGCSLGSADLYERWNNTNHQDMVQCRNKTTPKKLTLMLELGKGNVHNKRTRLSMRKKDTVTPKITYNGHTHSSNVLKSEPPTVQEDIIEWLRAQPSSSKLLEREACSQTRKSRISTWKASSPKRRRGC